MELQPYTNAVLACLERSALVAQGSPSNYDEELPEGHVRVRVRGTITLEYVYDETVVIKESDYLNALRCRDLGELIDADTHGDEPVDSSSDFHAEVLGRGPGTSGADEE